MSQASNFAAGPAARSNRAARCLLCEGETKVRDHLPHLWHQAGGSPSYDVRWCDACEFGFLDPRPTAADLARFAADARRLRSKWPDLIPSQASFLEKLRVRIAWQVSHGGVHSALNLALIEEFSGPRPASICTIGAWGTLLSDLLKAGHQVTAIEGDESDRAVLATCGVTVHGGSIESPPSGIPLGRFEVVIVRGPLERCWNPRLAIESASRFVKPGGCLMVEIPNNHACSARRLGQAWYHGDAGNILNFFTVKSLSSLVESSGLPIVHRIYTNYITQFRHSRLEIEQKLWDHLYSNVDCKAIRPPPRKSQWELWRGLASSMFRHPDEMYETIGVVARKPGE